ncbi:hypothetical protein [Acinetobacter sp. ANC 5584]
MFYALDARSCQAQQLATETVALTEQVQIKLSAAEFEHLLQLDHDVQQDLPDRLKQAAQLLDQEGL